MKEDAHRKKLVVFVENFNLEKCPSKSIMRYCYIDIPMVKFFFICELIF